MRRRGSLIVALTLLASLLWTEVASADHGDTYQNTKSGRCVAVPEVAGSQGGHGTAQDTDNVPLQSDGSSCEGGRLRHPTALRRKQPVPGMQYGSGSFAGQRGLRTVIGPQDLHRVES